MKSIEIKKTSEKKLPSFMRVHPIHQVLDVCLSIYIFLHPAKHPMRGIECVFRMQDIQLEINEINNNPKTPKPLWEINEINNKLR